MINLLLTLVLSGQISNVYGRIGVTVNHVSHIITNVYKISPAKAAGLEKGDEILSSDGVKGITSVDGAAFTTAHLTIKKKDGNIIQVEITRVPRSEVR